MAEESPYFQELRAQGVRVVTGEYKPQYRIHLQHHCMARLQFMVEAYLPWPFECTALRTDY